MNYAKSLHPCEIAQHLSGVDSLDDAPTAAYQLVATLRHYIGAFDSAKHCSWCVLQRIERVPASVQAAGAHLYGPIMYQPFSVWRDRATIAQRVADEMPCEYCLLNVSEFHRAPPRHWLRLGHRCSPKVRARRSHLAGAAPIPRVHPSPAGVRATSADGKHPR